MEKTNLSTVSNSYIDFAKGCIVKFQAENGRLPQKKEIAEEVSVEYLTNTYGSWENTLIQLGLKEKLRAEDTLESLKNLRDTLGVIPSITNVKEAGINVREVIKKYDSWNNVKKILKEEFTTVKPKRSLKKVVTAEDLAEAKLELSNRIIELTTTLGKVPTVLELKQEKIAITKIMKHFGSWSVAKEELGLLNIEKDMIAKEIIETQKSTTIRLTAKDLEDMDVSYGKVKKLFGSWKNACEEIGLNEVRKESVKEQVVNLTNKLERTPSCKEIKAEGIPLLFITKEMPWKEVKTEWNLDNISNDYTIQSILDLTNKLDYTPTIQELKENNVKTHKLFKQNGGWNKVREMIGLSKHSKYTNSFINDMEIQLLDLAEEIGKTPSYTLAKEKGIVVNALKAKYGSWNNVLFGVGLRLNSKYTDEAIDQLTNNIRDLADKLGKTPTISQMKEYGIAINPLRRKYGSLEVCFDSIGLTPNIQTEKTYNKEKVLIAIQGLKEKIGKIPSAKMAKEEGIKISRLIKEIGSWKQVKELLKASTLEDMTDLQTAM